ncbi:MAG: transporter [Armatimonadetes bacterium]|nr:transporter [Armatimonadota bacterium]
MAWWIALVFLACAAAMYTKRLPALLALPLMALAIALLPDPGHPLAALELVFGEGTKRLAGAMTNAVFGAMLAHVVQVTGIGEAIVKLASELAGDRPVTVALIMTVATALAFVSLTGLGAVVMIGSVVLPILVGVGIPPRHAAGILLFAVSLGGTWNVANWGFYSEVLRVPQGGILAYACITGSTLGLAALAYLLVNARAVRRTWAQPVEATPPPPLRPYALVTPIVPVVLILGFKLAGRDLNINAALSTGLFYGILTTRPRELSRLLSASIIEGIRAMAPVVGLMMGIGMAVVALMSDPVKAAMEPLLRAVVPHSPAGFVLFFGLLSPLALYRGPLNLYGLGAGIAAILSAVGLPAGMVTGALMSTGLIQGVCDPTNTHNVWIGGFTQTDVNEILRATLPYAWAATVVSLAVIACVRR